MKRLLATILLSLSCAFTVSAQDGSDVFVPIAKYITQGNVESLSAWFGDALDVSVLGKGAYSSNNQAKKVIKSFFSAHVPNSFEISHLTEKKNMKCAVGVLDAGDEKFFVTIFMSLKGSAFQIRQISIDRHP